MSFGFYIQEALRSVYRAKRLNFITWGAMSMTLLALGLIVSLNLGIYWLASFVEEKVELVMFINDDATAGTVESLLGQIKDHPQVIGAEYISKEDALQKFSQDAALKRFIEVLGNNPLPASIRIRLTEKSPETINRFITWLNTFPGAGEVSYGGGEVDRLLTILQFVRWVVILFTGSLIVATIVVIANVISLMVFSREEEITLMRMIGATNGFIRAPFLIWGIIQGTLGGVTASGTLYLIGYGLEYYGVHELGLDVMAWLPPESLSWAFWGAGGLVGIGCVLGFLGSLISVGRRLDV